MQTEVPCKRRDRQHSPTCGSRPSRRPSPCPSPSLQHRQRPPSPWQEKSGPTPPCIGEAEEKGDLPRCFPFFRCSGEPATPLKLIARPSRRVHSHSLRASSFPSPPRHIRPAPTRYRTARLTLSLNPLVLSPDLFSISTQFMKQSFA